MKSRIPIWCLSVVLLATPLLAINNAPNFDGAGGDDIFWVNPKTGRAAEWLQKRHPVNNSLYYEQVFALNLDNAYWRLGGLGDANSDGLTDIFWYNRTNLQVIVWTVSGSSVTGFAVLGTLPNPNWRVARAGDLDADSDADLLLYNDVTGEVAVWILDGTIVESMTNLLTTESPYWKPTELSDFNADGNEDVLWENIHTGQMAIWQMNGNAIVAGHLLPALDSNRWRVAGVANFMGSSDPDIVFQNLDTGQLLMWIMGGFQPVLTSIFHTIPASNMVVAVGDYDGDNDADLLVEQPATPNVTYLEMNAGFFVQERSITGISGSQIVVPDGTFSFPLGMSPVLEMPSPFQPETGYEINQDGDRDLLWLNRNDGRIQRWLMNGTGTPAQALLQTLATGWTGFASGDMDHDGFADAIVHHQVGQLLVIFFLDQNGNIRAQKNYPTEANLRLLMAGDGNGDPWPDLYFQDARTDPNTVGAGRVSVWYMRHTNILPITGAPINDFGYELADMADFTNDIHDDFLFQHDTTSQIVVWRFFPTQQTFIVGTPGANWRVAGAADFDNDADSDILLQNISSGQTQIWFMNATALTASAPLLTTDSPEWRVNGLGDYDGDGLIDIAWKHRQTSDVAIWFMAGGAAIREGVLMPNLTVQGWTGANASQMVEP